MAPPAPFDAVNWDQVTDELDRFGAAPLGPLLSVAECRQLTAGFDDDARYRATIDMGRHRFGSGTYRYFADPLPPLVTELRAGCWPHLLPVARAWADRLGDPAPWPDEIDAWLAQCHAAGQTRPTPLILRYDEGDWNALHRDLYGDLVFPLQLVIGLDRPGEDHTGGELIVVEQRPRAQSRATTIALPQGHGAVITTRDRPVPGARGWSRHAVRHGVSVVRSGRRHALGIIFHDAT